MGKVVAGSTISLDGFITDRTGSLGPLYPDLEALRESEMLKESIRNTGAVVMGRHAYDLAQGDLTGYEFQVPIFVLTHHPPEHGPRGENDRLRVFFVTDGIASAIRQARAAAGNKQVTIVGGAGTFQQILEQGLADELEIGIMPILLGQGLRLFEHLADREIALEKVRIFESAGGRTDILFRIVKEK